MSAERFAPADNDPLWLCNSTDHERYDTHDYCLVHEVVIPTDQACPETLRRLAALRAAGAVECLCHEDLLNAVGCICGADMRRAMLREHADRIEATL